MASSSPVGTSATGKCIGFWETLCRICAIIWNKRKTGDPCSYIPARVITRPDPCIYSQFMLMQLRLPVTWANPDVSIFLGGIKQDTFNLSANTVYDVQITVHNSSHDQVADNTQVNVSYIEFGAGGLIRHPITLQPMITDVPVWPGVSVVKVPWQTPATPGHYCIDIRLYHPRDANPANNHGWNNTQVYNAHSPVRTSMRVFNRWVAGPPTTKPFGTRAGAVPGVPWNLVEVTADSYVFTDAYGHEAHPDRMFAPTPPAWPVHVDPAIFHFEPDETYRDVAITIDAPIGPGPAEDFNITARQGGAPLGGITVTVTH